MKKRPLYWPYFVKLMSAAAGEPLLADDIPAAGMLIGLGFARAENGYDGPRIWITDKGRKVFDEGITAHAIHR
jgi:hypothetical protein